MQIGVLSKLDADDDQAFHDPFTAWVSAIGAEKKFNDEGLAALRQVAEFSRPYLQIAGTFDASKIVCPTPDEMTARVLSSCPAISAMLNLLRAAQLYPISYPYENGGQLAVHISPRRSDSIDRRSFLKSTSALRGHTDASFNPSPEEYRAGDQEFVPSPDFLILGCIRNPDKVPTNIVLLSQILQRLTEREIALLSEPTFILTPQPSFDLSEEAVRTGAVLWRDDSGAYCCRFSHKHIAVDEEIFPEAAKALEAFQQLVAEHSRPIVLNPGDILILNNRTLVHGRGEVGSEWNSQARWLMRMYAWREAHDLSLNLRL